MQAMQLPWAYLLVILSLGLARYVLGEARGMIAFNCSHEDAASSEFSLLHHGVCPDFGSSQTYVEKQITLQLLQRK